MAALSDYLEAALLNHLFRDTAFAKPLDTYVALFTTDPTDAGSGTEVSGGGYTRMEVNIDGLTAPFWTAPASEAEGGQFVENDSVVTFPEATADWGTVTHIGIFDAATAGNLLIHGALTASEEILTGRVFRFKAGDLDLILR